MHPKTLLLFLIVCFLSEFSSGQKSRKFFRSDYTYIESTKSFYKVHTTPLAYDDAREMCSLEGASMFYAENRAEADAVISFWNKTQPSIPWLFVGLNDMMAEGYFETIDGRPISEVYSSFYFNQPDNGGGANEDCVHMDLKAHMNDYRCDAKSYFICRKTLESLKWNYDCNCHNLDYQYTAVMSSSCYKLHTSPLTWPEAYARCRIEGAFLAIITTELVAETLVNLTLSSRKPSVEGQGKYQRGIYHLGFHNRFNKGWQTVEGVPLWLVPQNLWFDNIHPAATSAAECGGMFFNGRLINTDCNMRSMFICEQRITFPDESGSVASTSPTLSYESDH